MAPQLRPYHFGDAGQVVALWNRCLPADPITREMFDEKLPLDPNFDPAGCLLAEDSGRVVGFSYALIRRTALPWGFEAQFERDRGTGWVFALFVHEDYRRRGLGSALLQESLAFLQTRDVKQVILGNYAPNYVLSGVDTEAYPGAQEFFAQHGFRTTGQSYGMGIDLSGYRRPPEAAELAQALAKEGIVAEHFTRAYLQPTLAFLQESFPSWLSLFTDKLARGHDLEEMVIARRGEEVVGYCQYRYGHHAERTGPFGVKADLRGKKVGTLMLCCLLERMAQEGYRFGWFAQTGDRQRAYYERVGYRVMRTQVGMSKQL